MKGKRTMTSLALTLSGHPGGSRHWRGRTRSKCHRAPSAHSRAELSSSIAVIGHSDATGVGVAGPR